MTRQRSALGPLARTGVLLLLAFTVVGCFSQEPQTHPRPSDSFESFEGDVRRGLQQLDPGTSPAGVQVQAEVLLGSAADKHSIDIKKWEFKARRGTLEGEVSVGFDGDPERVYSLHLTRTVAEFELSD